jgi:hypothetical protein
MNAEEESDGSRSSLARKIALGQRHLVGRQGNDMTSKDAEIARILEMTDEESRAHAAAQGPSSEAAKPESLGKDPPMEQLEKELFGASLDDIVNLSEFADLEIRRVGFVRQNQENSAPLGPARSRRDRSTPTQRDDSTRTGLPSRVSKKSD